MFSGNGRDYRSRRRDSNQGWRWSWLVSNFPSCLQGREGLNGSWCSSRENLFQTITDISTVVNLKKSICEKQILRKHFCDINLKLEIVKMLYFWITNAVKKSRTPPGSPAGPGFFMGGSISGSEKQKSLSLMSLNSASKHQNQNTVCNSHSQQVLR